MRFVDEFKEEEYVDIINENIGGITSQYLDLDGIYTHSHKYKDSLVQIELTNKQ